MKKILCVLCLLCVMATVKTPVSAAVNEDVDYCSSYNVDFVDFSVTSSFYGADVAFTDYAKGSMTITLQKKSGSSWNYVTSTSLTFSDEDSAGKVVNRTNSKGTYRVQVTVTSTVDGYKETKTYTSGSFTV